EDWERMNAMNWVFVPHGLTPAILERHFRRAYRVFYTRPDVLWGLAKAVAHEPRFLRRVATYVRVGLTGWLATPTSVAPPQTAPAASRCAPTSPPSPPPTKPRQPWDRWWRAPGSTARA